MQNVFWYLEPFRRGWSRAWVTYRWTDRMAVSNRPILYSSDIVTRALINVLYQQLLHARLAELNVHCFSQACFRGGRGRGRQNSPLPRKTPQLPRLEICYRPQLGLLESHTLLLEYMKIPLEPDTVPGGHHHHHRHQSEIYSAPITR